MNWLDLEFSWSRGRSFPGGTTGNPRTETLTGAQLLELLTTHVEASSKHGVLYFSPGLQPAGGRRQKKTAFGAQIFAFDFDGADGRGESNRWIVGKLRELERRGIAYAAYTSHSHGAKAKPLHSRLRIVVFASRPVADAEEYAGVWRGWSEFFDHRCDPAPKAINAVFYPPTHPPGETRKWIRAHLGGAGEQARGGAEASRGALFNPGVWYRKATAKPIPAAPVDLTTPAEPRIAAARNVLETMEPRLEGHAHTAAVRAGLLGHDYGIVWEQWRDAIVGSPWNQRCSPPYTAGELEEHAGERLYESAENPYGWRWRSNADAPAEEDDPNAIHVPDKDGDVDRDLLVRTVASLDERFPDGAIVLLRAPVSAGKTEGIARLAEKFDEVKAVSPTIALGRELCTRLGAAWHDDARDAKRMVSTMASSHKYERRGHLFVMDEAPRCLESLAKGPTVRDKPKAWKGLKTDLLESKIATLASADLTMEDYRWILRIAGKRTVAVVGVSGQILRPTIKLHSVRAAMRLWLERVREQKPGGCRVLACDSRRDVEEMAQAARLENAALDVLEIHGESDRRNLQKRIAEADVIVFNAAAGDGLNITRDVLDVTALHTMRERGGEAVLQQLARARNVQNTEIILGCSRFKFSNQKPVLLEEIRKYRVQREEVLRAAADEAKVANERYDNPELDELCDLVELKRNVAWCDPMTSLYSNAHRYGWEVVDETAPLDEKGKDPDPGPNPSTMRQAAEDVRLRHVAGLCAARDIDEQEYEEIRRKRERSPEDRYLLARYRTRWLVGPRVFDADPDRLLELDGLRGRYTKRCQTLALAQLWTTHAHILLKLDVGGRRHSSQIRKNSLEAQLFVEVCGLFRIRPGDALTVTSAELGDKLEALQEPSMAALIRMCGRRVPKTRQGASQLLLSLFSACAYTRDRSKSSGLRVYSVQTEAALHVEAIRERFVEVAEAEAARETRDTKRILHTVLRVRAIPALDEL